MRAVNLLPKEFQTRKSIREEDPAVVVGSALGVLVMIALGAAFLMAHSAASSRQKRLTEARLELAQLAVEHRPKPRTAKPAVPITPIVPPPSITGEEASWLSAVSMDLSQRIAWDRLLREVSLVVPSDVTLTSLTLTAPTTVPAVPGVVTSAPAGAAQDFVVAGNAFSYDSVARLLSRLALVPDLSDVTLTSTGSGASPGSSTGGQSSSPGDGVQFNISAAVKGAPAPAAPAEPAPVPAADTTTAASS